MKRCLFSVPPHDLKGNIEIFQKESALKGYTKSLLCRWQFLVKPLLQQVTCSTHQGGANLLSKTF
ncbi:MAG: hypothetical protein CSA20_03745 [Deltaproteobacteria bacterium]|nr:MAG: hypothetical protein CSA20_03745 [Deltaproteobacteria bacterium]